MSIVHDYTRRVSFNNIDSEYNDVDFHKFDYGAGDTASLKFNDINFGYGSSVINDVSSYYDHGLNGRRSSLPKQSKRKKLSPSKSILKNKLSPQQLQYNIKNSKTLGINYHENLDDLITNDPNFLSPTQSHESSDEEDSGDDSHYTYGRKISNASSKSTYPKSRRKSYSDMTDEELMALDPQFSNTKPKIDQFKFDNHKTYYLPSKKAAAIPPKLTINKVDTSTNYKSINLTYRNDEFRLQRTLLTIVTGRRHTWSSLYWLVNSNFLQHDDYLIISSLISPRAMDSKNPSEVLISKCKSLIDWFLTELKNSSCNHSLRLKVTVEFIIDESLDNSNGNKAFFNNLFHQYNPNLLIVGNKSTNLNFKYPIKLKEAKCKFLVKFSSFLIKYSSIPVIVINNSIISGSRTIEDSVSHKDSIVSMQSSNSSITSDQEKGEEDSDSDSDTEPVRGNELYQDSIDTKDAFEVFESMMTRISDKSLKESKEYLEQLKAYEAGEEDTGSPKPYHPGNDYNQDVSPTTTPAADKQSETTPPGGPSIKFDPAVNFSASAGTGPKSARKSKGKSKPLNFKIHSIYTSSLSRQSSSNSDMYKVKSLIDSNSTENVSSKSLKSVKSNDSGISGSTRHTSTNGSVSNGSGMTTKMIKSGLKKEAEKPRTKAKKSVWKRIFS